MRGLNSTAVFDLAQRCQDIARFDGRYRHGSDLGENVPFEPGGILQLGAAGTICCCLEQPLARQRLEGVYSRSSLRVLGIALGLAGVDVGHLELPGAGSGRASLRERDLWVAAKRKAALLARGLQKLHSPELRACRHNLQIQTAAVSQLVRLVLRLGVFNLDVSQGRDHTRHFRGILFCIYLQMPLTMPLKIVAVNWQTWAVQV